MGWWCLLCLLATVYVYCSPTSFALSTENEERDALLDLYTATQGSSWKNNSNWGFGSPCLSDWYGVNCVGGQVTFL